MKTTMKKNKTTTSKKIREDYYFILQLYSLSKNLAYKKEPSLPGDDNRKLVSKINASKQGTLIRAFRQHVFTIAAPVFKRN